MTTGEGTRVKKVLAAILLAIGGMMAGTGALAQVQMDVYFTANAKLLSSFLVAVS